MARASIKNLSNMIDSETNSFRADVKFLTDLKISIEQHSVRNSIPSKTYKPSSLQCMRCMYYQIIGVEIPPQHTESGMVGIHESGSDRHDRIQKAIIKLSQTNKDYEYVDIEAYISKFNIPYVQVIEKRGLETKCYHEVLNLSFMTDGIIRIKDKYYIFEYKTETSFKFQARNNIDDGHITQGCCYATAFMLDDIIFIYENRDVCSKKSFLLHVTDDMKMGRVVNRINECDGYVDRMIAPPKNKTKSCIYCNYQAQCSQDK